MNTQETERKQAEVFLKEQFIEFEIEGRKTNTEHDWDRLPEEHKNYWCTMLMEYKRRFCVADALEAIMKEAKKSSHSDASLGFAVKQILKHYQQ